MKTPKLRFMEFSGDWESKKLGELGEFKNGINKSKNDFGYGYPFINLNDVFGKNIIDNNKYELVNVTNKELEENNLIKGDVLFIRSSVKPSGVGLTSVVIENLENTVYSGFLIRFRDKNNLNLNFKKYCFYNKKFRKELLRKSSTSANTNINQENLKILNLNIPSLKEQEKIASFLSLVDEKINLQNKKVENLKNYKKGIISKIFKRELRFKDDNGNNYSNWEEKKLGECLNNKGGTALEKFIDENGTHKFISIGNYDINGKYIDNNQRINLNDKTKDKLLYKDDLVMVLNDKTSTGDLIGSTILIEENNRYIYNQRSERLICNKNIYPYFAWITLNYEGFRKKVFSISQGGTQIYVNFSSVKELKINLPCLDEQIKISSFLSLIDEKIEKEAKKLDLLNDYKKGLLQQMFV